LPVRWKTVAGSITRTLRNISDGVTATAQQLPRRRVVILATTVVILVALALLVPLPTAVELRDWSRSLGPWFPLAFLAAHAAVTVFPFPRTAFTLAAGLLFGIGYGVLIAVTASTLSALVALLLVRAAGWHLSRLVSHPAIEIVDTRLRQRGWLAVLSLRLIPAVPFAVINYAAGASAVRVIPYGLATFVGLLPGTAAMAILGDAFTGNVSPMLALVSVCTGAAGVAGLVYEIRKHHREHAKLREPGEALGDGASARVRS
jgi:uncharacterized membrane protein YdjX (TVP38/TMEM64 family)